MGFRLRAEEAEPRHPSRDGPVSQPAYGARAAPVVREEHGGEGPKYIGPVVYGGLDGIVTTFAVVSGVAGAALGANVVLILGLANLFADGVSMATGAFLSARSENEYYQRERELERSQVERAPEAERVELAGILTAKGYGDQEATDVIDIQSRDEERLVDTMMVQELGLVPEERRPLLIGLATLASFVVAGSVPLSLYLVGLAVPIAPAAVFPISAVLTAIALFGWGAARVLVTERNWLRSGLEMLAVGGLAAGVAYLVGNLLRGLGA